jgi:hypothetical protein
VYFLCLNRVWKKYASHAVVSERNIVRQFNEKLCEECCVLRMPHNDMNSNCRNELLVFGTGNCSNRPCGDASNGGEIIAGNQSKHGILRGII